LLNDVWYNIQGQVHFLTRNTFDQAPAVPAVYAWYYPLRVSTYDLKTFLEEVIAVMSYDAKSDDIASMESVLSTAWRKYHFTLDSSPTVDEIPRSFANTWERVVKERFESMRMDLMRLSLFMPPLYVGKTNSLARRLREHIDGRAPAGDFHARFRNFAEERGLSQRTVADLLCVAITTPEESASDEYVELIEYIMKTLAGPGFSVL
jgi:hypothetical protein